jgi:hypothetical protein
MWRLYNTITDRNGLDTVRNLAINGAVFLVVGIALGVALAHIERGLREHPEERPTSLESEEP